jgi:hypothetical protein
MQGAFCSGVPPTQKMQGESSSTYGYHSANATMVEYEDEMDEATTEALVNLSTATASYRSVVVAVMEANSRLTKQLEDRSSELKAIRELLKKEHTGCRYVTPCPDNYCWSHGYKVDRGHTNQIFRFPIAGHNHDARKSNNMGGSQSNNKLLIGGDI